ncbi:hypothetical protein DFP72DRAFT_908640, partial [Ephemerocybe angulata]
MAQQSLKRPADGDGSSVGSCQCDGYRKRAKTKHDQGRSFEEGERDCECRKGANGANLSSSLLSDASAIAKTRLPTRRDANLSAPGHVDKVDASEKRGGLDLDENKPEGEGEGEGEEGLKVARSRDGGAAPGDEAAEEGGSAEKDNEDDGTTSAKDEGESGEESEREEWSDEEDSGYDYDGDEVPEPEDDDEYGQHSDQDLTDDFGFSRRTLESAEDKMIDQAFAHLEAHYGEDFTDSDWERAERIGEEVDAAIESQLAGETDYSFWD